MQGPDPDPPKELTVSQELLCSSLLGYYSQLRADELPALTEAIPAEFINIQKQIIGVVELRKTMEKILEVDALQSQHFATVQNLVQHSMRQEQSIDQLSCHINALERSNMSSYVQFLKDLQGREEAKESQIIERGQRLVLELSDFKRGFNVEAASLLPSLPSFLSADSEDLQIRNWQHEQHFSQLMQSQQRRWDLAKSIYAIKLREINLRDELLEERERAHQDFQRSNCELIDTLLREKERDKNLRKKDNQKFGEVIKQRDQIDLENENLSHSEKSLLPHLQNQLLRMKAKLKEQDSRHDIDLQKLQKRNEELAGELQRVTREKNALGEALVEQEAAFKEKLSELKASLDASLEKKKATEATLKTAQTETEDELERLKLRFQQIESENLQLEARNEQLQSQYNELILKSSQLNHIKAELSQKFERTAKKSQQLESKLQELKANLTAKDQELQNLQLALQSLNSEKDHYQQLISALQQQLKTSLAEIQQSEEKTSLLEIELTQNFVLHNSDRNHLQQELDQQTQLTSLLHTQIQELKASQSSPAATGEASDPMALFQTLKSEISLQLERSSRIKFRLIDELVDKVTHFMA